MTLASGVEHLVLSGELDPVGAPGVEPLVRAALARGADAIVLHLADVEFIDSGGLHALLGAAEAAQSAGTDLLILPGRPQVMAVIEDAGVAGRLPFVGYP